MEERIITAKTLDEAITKACVELGVPSDELEYTVKQTGSNGFFGLGAKPYVISAKVKGAAAAADTAVDAEKKAPAGETAKTEAKKAQKPFAKESGASRGEGKDPFEKGNAAEQAKVAAADTGAGAAAAAGEAAKDKKADRPARSENRNDRRERYEKKDRSDRQDRRNKKDRGERGERNDRQERGERNDRRERRNQEAKSQAQREPRQERKFERLTEDPTPRAEKFLQDLFASMEMKIECRASFNPDTNDMDINLSGEDMGVLIGKRGQTLDALQYLTSQVVNKHLNSYVRVKLDTENYRERRQETLETLAVNIAHKVRRNHRPVALEPMNPYERRIIHSVLQGEKDVTTRSEGEEPYRHVVVVPVKKRGGRGFNGGNGRSDRPWQERENARDAEVIEEKEIAAADLTPVEEPADEEMAVVFKEEILLEEGLPQEAAEIGTESISGASEDAAEIAEAIVDAEVIAAEMVASETAAQE